MQRGESALQIAVRKGHLDVVKVLVQVCRDLHMENEVDQYYMDLADDHHHEHLVEYLSSEFPTLKRKVSLCSQYSICIHTHIHQYLSKCLGTPSAVCHITCVLTHFASSCSRIYSYSDVFIHACRYECHSHSQLCIPKYGLHLDLVIQTTSTVKQHVLCSTCNTALDDTTYTHKGVTELIFR